jgi:hypothetical protein
MATASSTAQKVYAEVIAKVPPAAIAQKIYAEVIAPLPVSAPTATRVQQMLIT